MNRTAAADPPVLVLGIGNVLMGDEGVGVEVVRRVECEPLPPGVTCLDGGTGGFTLLGAMHAAGRVVLIDATSDGQPTGTLRRLQPRFSSDYPTTLTAHDIGLKDLLDTMYLLGDPPEVTLFAVSIEFPQPMGCELSPTLVRRISGIVESVLDELRNPAVRAQSSRNRIARPDAAITPPASA